MVSQEGIRREIDLAGDVRWQLVERVIASPAFQRSNRLRDLLRHIAERTIRGQANELTEQHIGQVVFGKPADYSPNEDSSVRVHARQLRLKLHEYFDGDGRGEALVLEIPKGSYAPIFRPVQSAAPVQTSADTPPAALIPEVRTRPAIWTVLPWLLTAVMTVVSIFLWQRPATLASTSTPAPWPLSAVFNKDYRTQIIVADINYGMLQFMSQKSGSLEQYLMPNVQQAFGISNPTERESRILTFLDKTLHTSYADVAVVAKLITAAGDRRDQVSVRSARDLNLRELEEGNYILVGSPISNPWVSLFDSKLNFKENHPFGSAAVQSFINKRPGPNEETVYQGLQRSGEGGDDYATIALLPNSRRGSVLILQGLHQEGTEGVGLFLGEPENRKQLREALGIQKETAPPVFFEALLRTTVVAGAPKSTRIVTTRILH